MRARWFLTLAAGLWLAAGARDAFDDWVDATLLPPLVLPVSVEVDTTADITCDWREGDVW